MQIKATMIPFTSTRMIIIKKTFWGAEKVLKLAYGDGCTIFWINKKGEVNTLNGWIL